MSQVRASQRKPSSVQYVDTACELLKHTISYARKFPKSLMFLFTKDVVDSAKAVYAGVVKANSCFPSSQKALDFRYEQLSNAKASLDVLDGLVSIALEMYADSLLPKTETIHKPDGTQKTVTHGISEYGWVHWGELIKEERKLIKGIMSKDAQLSF